ncbi:MAG: hypothetical protein K6F73_06160 [Lachnospiraceae bacterium]|nr:hypothetical protein [Lachnospiraceae bacterium]
MKKIIRSAERILTGMLAAAVILSALPEYAFASESAAETGIPEAVRDVTEYSADTEINDIGNDDISDDVTAGENDLPEDGTEAPDDGTVISEDQDDEYADDAGDELQEADEEYDELSEVIEEETEDDELQSPGDHSDYKITVTASADNDPDTFTYDFEASGAEGLAKDEGTWYFALSDGEAVSSFKFEIKAAENYHVSSVEGFVANEGKRLTASRSGDLWTFRYCRLDNGFQTPLPIDRDITLTVVTEPLKTVTFTGGIRSKYNVTLWGELSPLSSDKCSVIPGSSPIFTVSAKDGYRIVAVMIDDKEISPDSTGRYCLPPVNEDVEVKVVTRGGPVEILYNFDTNTFKLTTTGTTGTWMDGRNPLMTAGKAINATIGKAASAPSGTDLSSYDFTVTYQYGELLPKPAEVSSLKFTVPLDEVIASENTQTDLTIKIVAIKKQIKATVAPGGHATFYYYDPVTGSTPSIGSYSDYGEKSYVITIPDENYKVTGVKAGTSGLRAVKKQIMNGSELLADCYYVLPASVMKKDFVLTAVTDPLPMQNSATVIIDKHDVTLTPTTRGVVTNEDGTVWTIPAGTKSLTYTIETTGSYLASATISDGEDREVHMPVPEVNKSKSALVYKLSGAAADYAGKTLRVGGGEYERKIKMIPADDNIDPASLSVRENGRAVNAEVYEDPNTHVVTYFYRINDPFAMVTVSASCEKGYKLSGKAVVNGKEAKLMSGSVSFMTALCDDTGCVNVSLGTVPALTVKVKTGEAEKTYSGNVKITDVSRNTAPEIELFKGGRLSITKNDVSVTPATSGFAAVSDNKVLINPKAAPDDKERKVSITLPDPSDSKKTITVSVSFSVSQPINNVKITGEKTGADNKPFISQARGTSAKYAVSLDKGRNINDLSAEAGEGVNASARIDPVKKKLIVETFKGEAVTEGDSFVISLKDTADDAVVRTLTVNLTAPALKEPAITVSQTSDIGMVLTLAEPKNTAFVNLYYMVTATASSAGNARMKNSLTEYVKASAEGPSVCTLTLANDVGNRAPVMGEGSEQEYTLSACLVMAQGDPGAGGSVLAAGKAKTLTKQRTKKPNLTKAEISLTRKNATFIQGQKDVIAAVAKFSKDTSYTAVGEAYVENEKGIKVEGISIVPGIDGTIKIADTSAIPVGKATLVVSPDCPEGVISSPARLKLTVKAPIDKIDITPETGKLYKQDQKAATLRLSAKTYWDGDDADDSTWGKSASSKVTWSVAPVSADSPLAGHISISTAGTVTVDKNYVIDPDDAKNKFTVTAAAADFSGNGTTKKMTVEVTNR